MKLQSTIISWLILMRPFVIAVRFPSNKRISYFACGTQRVLVNVFTSPVCFKALLIIIKNLILSQLSSTSNVALLLKMICWLCRRTLFHGISPNWVVFSFPLKPWSTKSFDGETLPVSRLLILPISGSSRLYLSLLVGVLSLAVVNKLISDFNFSKLSGLYLCSIILYVLFLMVFPLELVLTLNNFSVFFMARLSSFDNLLMSKRVGD